mgnify:CR=1 FL=1
MQGKDFARELEDVPNVGKEHKPNDLLGDIKPENIISVGQQVANLLSTKNVTAEEKVYQLLT